MADATADAPSQMLRGASGDSIPAAQPDPDTVIAAEADLVALYKASEAAQGLSTAPEGPNRVDDVDDPLLAAAVAEGKVDSRGALGARFDRWLNSNPDKKQDSLGWSGRVCGSVRGVPMLQQGCD